MTELAPPLQSADSHTFLIAVDQAMQDPRLATKVDQAFGDSVLSDAHDDIRAWVKCAIDINLPTATNFAERSAAGEVIIPQDASNIEYISTDGDTDFKTGLTPVVELFGNDNESEEHSLDDRAGLLQEPDVYPVGLRPHEITGVEAHVALVALCAAAKKDIAAEELWERMPISDASRMLHEATLSDSRIVSKLAATLLRIF